MHVRLLATVLLVAGCNGESDNDPYGDRDRSPGDHVQQGDNNGGGGDPATPEFTLNIAETCPPFTPCGGDVVGTWVVTDVCVEESVLFYDLFDYCDTAVVDEIVEAPASGIVTFTNTVADRYAIASVTADVLIPAECGFCQCDLVEESLDEAVDATCNAICNASKQCECTVVADLVIDETGTYTTADNTITTGDGNTFDYCITGNQFQYINTNVTDPEPGLYTMSRR